AQNSRSLPPPGPAIPPADSDPRQSGSGPHPAASQSAHAPILPDPHAQCTPRSILPKTAHPSPEPPASQTADASTPRSIDTSPPSPSPSARSRSVPGYPPPAPRPL